MDGENCLSVQVVTTGCSLSVGPLELQACNLRRTGGTDTNGHMICLSLRLEQSAMWLVQWAKQVIIVAWASLNSIPITRTLGTTGVSGGALTRVLKVLPYTAGRGCRVTSS